MLEEKKQPLWQLNDAEAVSLCGTLRRALLGSVSQTGGHLASNLGVVELTVALHRVYDLEEDRLVFDVGHQCYVHKMLTGREDKMGTLRQFGGLSGFPRPWESKADAFVAGHASNAVSVALGMARARTLLHQNHHVIALLGDGALTGGLAYEGLSNAGQSGEPMLVILNDNGMSIQENVGGIANLLAHQRLKPHYLRFKKGYRKVMNALPGGQQIYRVTHKLKQGLKEAILSCSMFEEMGFTYIGPVDGHDVAALTRLLQWIKTLKTPVLLHVRTVKGKGCDYAEQTPDAYHGVSPFNLETGFLWLGRGRTFPPSLETRCVRWRKKMGGSVPSRRLCSPAAVWIISPNRTRTGFSIPESQRATPPPWPAAWQSRGCSLCLPFTPRFCSGHMTCCCTILP